VLVWRRVFLFACYEKAIEVIRFDCFFNVTLWLFSSFGVKVTIDQLNTEDYLEF